jgi:uncharacterized protein YdaU (DUF1376 family)
MIDIYYQSEQPFNDRSTLARRIRTSVEIVDVILHEFFVLEDDGCWHNKRVDEEIAKYHGKLDQASRAGKASAEARLNKRSTTVQPTKNQEPITKNQIINTPEGVSESIFKDYLEVRKAKKAKWTQTALKGLQREAEKAKMSLQDVIQLCCERNWVGFKAEWANSQNPVSKQGDDKSWMFSNQGIEAKAKELGVNDYGIQNHQQLKDKVLLVMAKKAMQ